MTNRAGGAFEVTLTPRTWDDPGETPPLGRMAIAKTFSGDLEATSVGLMLAAMSTVKGSAGYVAIERVSGSLNGKAGTFVLQHSGTMNRGAPELSVTVVPDSGTDQLEGLAGRMDIQVEAGKHSYVFDYTIGEAP